MFTSPPCGRYVFTTTKTHWNFHKSALTGKETRWRSFKPKNENQSDRRLERASMLLCFLFSRRRRRRLRFPSPSAPFPAMRNASLRTGLKKSELALCNPRRKQSRNVHRLLHFRGSVRWRGTARRRQNSSVVHRVGRGSLFEMPSGAFQHYFSPYGGTPSTEPESDEWPMAGLCPYGFLHFWKEAAEVVSAGYRVVRAGRRWALHFCGPRTRGRPRGDCFTVVRPKNVGNSLRLLRILQAMRCRDGETEEDAAIIVFLYVLKEFNIVLRPTKVMSTPMGNE